MARGRSRRRGAARWWLAVGAVLVLGAGVAGYLLYENHVRTRQLLAFNCATLTRLTESTAAERAALADAATGPTAVFFGDSYTQGVGLTDIRDVYAYVTADRLHWRAVLNAAGGTGYVNEGPCSGQQLSARVPQVAREDPQFVIVQAGLDDYRIPAQKVEKAAEQLYAQLRHALPNARVIVVGPHPVPKVANVAPIVAALRTATSRAHVAFIDTTPWRLSFEQDGIHLTVAGHREYGNDLANALTAAHIG